jgi:putative ABC transport system ATP-binding protein
MNINKSNTTIDTGLEDSSSGSMILPIQTENLGKVYHTGEVSVEVLKEVTFEVSAGEFVTIMGPSGSGKSTLLYLLGGLDVPSSGSVRIHGRDIASLNDTEASRLRRHDIGFVFQFYNLVPNLDVEENVLLPALLDGQDLTACRDRLDSILKTVGLSERRRHTPRELSGGQQQRVAIARALMNGPGIILADEPTGNLDSVSGEEVLRLLSDINNREGKTVVMVTHSREAASYGRRIIHVIDGRIDNEEKN